mmetsp:Transcript_106958/g.167074  ORF Transcript_106958/g.167074 Transcript_106958/m.167074 type:complete len:112 (+) Transcript_106958:914-1249(+)
MGYRWSVLGWRCGNRPHNNCCTCSQKKVIDPFLMVASAIRALARIEFKDNSLGPHNLYAEPNGLYTRMPLHFALSLRSTHSKLRWLKFAQCTREAILEKKYQDFLRTLLAE